MVNRMVVGAHYGLRDWLLQRVTAVVMLAYAVALVLFLLLVPAGFAGWKALFAATWVRVLTQVTLLALALHAWVGVRDIWMDYVKAVGLRLTLEVLTLLWLASCFVYSVKVVWGL